MESESSSCLGDSTKVLTDSITTPLVTEHPSIDFFDKEGHAELSKKLSRTASRLSTKTQDRASDEFDYGQYLKHLFKKIDENGLPLRQLGVILENVTVEGEGSGIAYGVTVGSLIVSSIRVISAIREARRRVKKTILHDITLAVKPTEMLLVLGRPGSGCSSLLKVISNNTQSFANISGNISYDGFDPITMKKHHAGEVAYLPEDDSHLPNLTVNETLTFAASARTPASGARLGTREEAIAETRDVLVSLFGLRHTLNTKVGNDVIRGVSGGERKRVSIAELMTTHAKIACHDNSTRGLDASTALEYTRALRIATDITHLTTILSIYQAGEQLFVLFDKVCVLYDGRMVYMGPMNKARAYFEEMGYEPQSRQTSADFLVAVTDPKGRFVKSGFEGRVPKTAREFADYFKASPLGQANLAEVAAQREASSKTDDGHLDQFTEGARKERAENLSKDSSYLISYPMQVRLAMKRRFQMQMGDINTLLITTIAAIFQALIIGSVYFQMPQTTDEFFSRGGVIFFAILYNAFTGMAEITSLYAQRPVVVRQRSYAMIRPSADILALHIVDIPFKFFTVFFFDTIIYFMTGLQTSASQFFIFVLFTFVSNLAMLAIFRTMASSNRSEAKATMFAGFLVLVIAIYVGYTVPRNSMKPWFRWLSYAQPISFCFESLLVNEFKTLNVPCSSLIPHGPTYANISIANQVCTVDGSVGGSNIVNGLSYLYETFGYESIWMNLGIIFAYYIFFVGLNLITTEYQPDESAAGAVMIFKRGTAPPELKTLIESSPEDIEKGSLRSVAIAELKGGNNLLPSASRIIQSSTDIFTWRNVNYDVPIKGETRRLLSDVSGFVVPGKMTALMGESGAGKTTLLNVLAQRVSMGIVTGDMLVNGKPLPISFQRQSAYVQQQDTHLATSTVREALIFSALLRQPASVSKEEKIAYVEEVITLLEMESFAEALVGEVGMGLNVEQRKRLSIGVELAAKPALLIFLDEPSSGLDSQSSWSILQLLRKLADHGQSVLATIHQPSSELFQVFDRLLLLKKGGKVVYFGEIGKNSHTLVDYFGARSDLKCAPTDNPAEYVLEVIGAGAGSHATQDWHKLWQESEESKTVQRQIDEFHNNYGSKSSAADTALDSNRSFASNSTTQIALVTQRAFQNYWRDSNYIIAKIMLNIIAGLFIGFSFYQSSANTSGLRNRIFAIFMIVVLASPLAVGHIHFDSVTRLILPIVSFQQQLQPKFIGLRTLYTAREAPSKMYDWTILVLSSIVVEIPWNIFSGTLLFFCWYWTVGLPTEGSRVGYSWLMYMLFQLYFASFAQAIAAISANGMAASVLFSSLFSFITIFAGVMQPFYALPSFWRFMYYLSPLTWIIEGLTTNALEGIAITCTLEEFVTLTPPNGVDCLAFLTPFTTSGTGYAQVIDGACGYCPFRSGEEFLEQLNMSFSHRYRDVGFLCAYIIFNCAMVFGFTYLFQIKNWQKVSFFDFFKRSAKK